MRFNAYNNFWTVDNFNYRDVVGYARVAVKSGSGMSTVFVLLGILIGVMASGIIVASIPGVPQSPAIRFVVDYDREAAANLCPGDELPFELSVDITRPTQIDITYSIHNINGDNFGNRSIRRDAWGYPEPKSFVSTDGVLVVPEDLPPGTWQRVATAGTTNNTIPAFYVIEFTVRDDCG